MSLQITLSYSTSGKQPMFIRVVYLAQLSAANKHCLLKYGWNVVTSHLEMPVVIVCDPNDIHDSTTTMFVACEMAGINGIQK